MKRLGVRASIVCLSAVAALVVAACVPPSPPATTARTRVTTWQSDIGYAADLPEIVSWVGFGSFAFNASPAACNIADGGAGWTQSFTRVDPSTVRVRLTLEWVEDVNELGVYGCGLNDPLNVGLKDASGTEVAFELVPLLSTT